MSIISAMSSSQSCPRNCPEGYHSYGVLRNGSPDCRRDIRSDMFCSCFEYISLRGTCLPCPSGTWVGDAHHRESKSFCQSITPPSPPHETGDMSVGLVIGGSVAANLICACLWFRSCLCRNRSRFWVPFWLQDRASGADEGDTSAAQPADIAAAVHERQQAELEAAEILMERVQRQQIANTIGRGVPLKVTMAEPCCICLDPLAQGDLGLTLPCAHLFHVDCIRGWLEQNLSCPLCKHSLVLDA